MEEASLQDPMFANIIEVVSDAASRQHQVQVDANNNPGALLPAFNGPLISFKRTTVFINYTFATLRNNTDGNARYRLQLFVQVQNLTNEANYLGYSGTLTSPFFGRPTTVRGMRKIDAGINLNF